MKKQSGFTLIELVMVIVILGILAAVALPKFVNLGGNARTSVIQGVAGSMRATNAEIYAEAAMTPGGLGATGSVAVGGQTVKTAYGYAASMTDLLNAMSLHPKSDFTISTNEVEMADATVPANCSVTYAPATATATPTYTTLITGSGGGC